MAKSSRYERDCLQLSLISAVQYLIGWFCLLMTLLSLPICLLMFVAAIASPPQSFTGSSLFEFIVRLGTPVAIQAVPTGLTYLFFLTARRLKAHRSYHFCCIVLAIGSFGTVLGLFLGIWYALVMNRQSVKDLFEAGDKAAEKMKRLKMEQHELQHAITAPRPPRKKADESLSGFREPERL